jgi:hypothetical protein
MTIYHVTNRESRLHTQDRYIVYNLTKELPVEWVYWTVDQQGYWLNENAEFISDSFSDVELEEIEEETIYVGIDHMQDDL